MKGFHLIFVVFIICTAPAAFSAPQNHNALYQEAFTLIKKKRYMNAKELLSSTQDPVAIDLVDWYQFKSNKDVNYHDIHQFLKRRPNWPRQSLLERYGETSLSSDLASESVLKLFSSHDPKTYHGKRLLLDARLTQTPNHSSIPSLVKNIWINDDFSAAEQHRFLKRFGSHLSKDDHAKRIDRLLWNNRITLSKKLLHLVTPNQRNVFDARIMLMQNKHGLDRAIAKLPANALSNPGFLYERIDWHKRKKRYDNIYRLIATVHQTMPYQHKWWAIKKRLFRELLEQKQYQRAYHIAAHHGNTKGSSGYAEAEWLAGWMALRYLDRPIDAHEHFRNMYVNVRFPISLARASYWAGRAAKEAKKIDPANKWFSIAKTYPFTFYGQLAAHELTEDPYIYLPPMPEKPMKARPSDLAKAAIILLRMNQKKTALEFLKLDVKRTNNTSYLHYLASLGQIHGHLDVSVKTAGYTLRHKRLMLRDYAYPLLSNIPDKSLSPHITLAITRQESRFDSNAISSANARGYMQLLPSTARRAARQLRIRYNTLKLNRDPIFNMQLGSHYYGRLLNQFQGSNILAAASYNAGATNARRWVKRFGNPSTMNDLYEVIDWMEHIPFAETRNYVQRVLENMQVYRSIIDQQPSNLPQIILNNKASHR